MNSSTPRIHPHPAVPPTNASATKFNPLAIAGASLPRNTGALPGCALPGCSDPLTPAWPPSSLRCIRSLFVRGTPGAIRRPPTHAASENALP